MKKSIITFICFGLCLLVGNVSGSVHKDVDKLPKTEMNYSFEKVAVMEVSNAVEVQSFQTASYLNYNSYAKNFDLLSKPGINLFATVDYGLVSKKDLYYISYLNLKTKNKLIDKPIGITIVRYSKRKDLSNKGYNLYRPGKLFMRMRTC